MGPELNGFAGGPGSYEATTSGKALLLVFRLQYRITILLNQKIDSNIVLRYCEPAAAYSRFIEAVNRQFRIFWRLEFHIGACRGRLLMAGNICMKQFRECMINIR